jgi:hypothetical protein
VKPEWVAPLSRGIRLSAALFQEAPSGEGTFGAFSPDDRLLAVIQRSGSGLEYLATFPEPAAAAAGAVPRAGGDIPTAERAT